MECLVGCKRDGKLARDDCAVRVDRLYSTVCSAILVRQQKLFVVRAPCARCARFEAAIMWFRGDSKTQRSAFCRIFDTSRRSFVFGHPK